MKISIALSLLVFSIGAVLGWHQLKQQTTDRTSYDQLVAEAAQVGITLDSTHVEDAKCRTLRERKNSRVDVGKVTAEFIAYAKEMETTDHKGGMPDEAAHKKWMKMNDSVMALNAAQLKLIIAELRANQDLKQESLQRLVCFSIMTLVHKDPQAAFVLFTESSDFLKEKGMAREVIPTSLATWAKDDPAAAREWVRANSKKFPDLVDDDARRGLISGAAVNDLKLAFKLIGELGLQADDDVIEKITAAAKTQEERTATLAALRAHLATLPEGEKRDEASKTAFRSLGRNATKEGFEAGTKWIDKAGLTSEEISEICHNGLNIKDAEVGQWLEWMGAKLPGEESNNHIRSLISGWTAKDYQAAGKWLATTPPGPTKNISISSYAIAVAQYEPESAAQWALTLPPGQDRDETLKNIYQKWPKGDDAAKAAFKKLHGIN